MFSKVVVLCAMVAVSQAGLLAAPVHYSPAASVSSQSIVRHDEAAPAARLAVAAPFAYHAAAAPLAYHAPAAPLAYHAPVAAALAHREDQEIAYPKYEFNYSVADAQSGDNKSQQESRDGDAVSGSYSFHEADGSIRTVEYTADDHNGFNAVVHNTAATAATAAPTIIKAAVPIAHVPVAHYYHH